MITDLRVFRLPGVRFFINILYLCACKKFNHFKFENRSIKKKIHSIKFFYFVSNNVSNKLVKEFFRSIFFWDATRTTNSASGHPIFTCLHTCGHVFFNNTVHGFLFWKKWCRTQTFVLKFCYIRKHRANTKSSKSLFLDFTKIIARFGFFNVGFFPTVSSTRKFGRSFFKTPCKWNEMKDLNMNTCTVNTFYSTKLS